MADLAGVYPNTLSQAQVLWHVQNKESKLRTQVHWEILRHFIETKMLQSFRYLNISDPCRSKRDAIPFGIAYPLDPQYTRSSGRLKKGLTPPTKIMQTYKISF